MIYRIFQFIRFREWYDSKVPFVMCFLWCCFLRNPSSVDMNRFTVIYVAGALFTGLFLAFGYMINDYSDREVDALAGKDKLIQHMSSMTIAASFGTVIALGIIPIVIVSGFSLSVFVAVILTYIIGASYSLQPFRFKEKGTLGLIISAFAQRCMPIFVLSLLMPKDYNFTALFTITSFLIGLRYIFIHQVVDLENDRISGVKTFALDHLNQVVAGVYIAFIVEIILLISIIMSVGSSVLWLIAGLSLVPEWTQCRMVTRFMGKKVMTTFCNVPMEGFENIILPIALSCICFHETIHSAFFIIDTELPFLVLIIMQIILLAKPAYNKLSLTVGYIRESGKAFFSDRMGLLIGLFQNLFMCVAISLTIAILNRKLNDPADILFSIVQSFSINCLADFIFEVGHFGIGFAGLFSLKRNSIAWRLTRNLPMVLIYVLVIGICMYLLKVGNPAVAMRLFASQFVILYLVGLFVSLMVEPLSIKIAGIVMSRFSKNN